MNEWPDYERQLKKRKNETVSVVVVCHNESPDRIRHTLDSVAGQDYAAVELVVVDGGSGTETLDALQSGNWRIDRFVSEPDNGIYDAMNKGVKLASGEWILFMNIGDRFYSADVLGRLVREGHCGGVDMIFGRAATLSSAQTLVTDFVNPRMAKWYLYYGYICHQAILARKRVFENIGGFDTAYRLISDRDWLLRFIRANLKSKSADMIVCDWELRGASSNISLVETERRKMVSVHFSKWEKILFRAIWIAIRIQNRIRTGNFSLPR